MNLVTRGLVMLLGLILLWQLVVNIFQLPPYILPTPLDVFKIVSLKHTLLISEAMPTLIETLIGLLLGTLFGCCAALIMAFFRPVTLWLLPLLLISQAIPTFAIAPLLVIWFGYGLTSKIATTVLMLFFPIMSAFFDGLRRTNPGWLDLAKTMQAKRWRIFWYIRIPAALPSLASGLRVATAIAPIGAIVGEWVGSSKGLGFLMLNANARMQIDLMFAAMVMIMLFSLLLYFIVDRLLRFAIPWQVEK
jgi:putative hydroxymethylpyrimidine transport system permease protein